ncbi:MAG: ABC transporter permease [Bryobacteraceae bacterium]|nr:ABC transporter permease [Bryobacteraceae bacterium]
MIELLPEIGRLTVEHLMLVGWACGAASLAGIALGVLVSRQPRWRPWIVGSTGILQTVPSLALLGFLIPATGIGAITATIALFLYALLPVVQNTVTGILEVDPAVRESAVALGMSPRQILREVELPLAWPTILGGIRIAIVTSIGTATIAAAVGGGGLGVLIFRGVATLDSRQILAGAVPAAILALLFEGVLQWFEKKLVSSR